ncbi:MAG: adenylosuccinate lyase, partial [Bacteroidota bacterium]
MSADSALLSISPVDGRYARQTRALVPYFSEYALMRYRVRVEIEYFIALCGTLPELRSVSNDSFPALQQIWKEFTEADAGAIKETEKTTNHDVKAVEYFVKAKLDALGLGAVRE